MVNSTNPESFDDRVERLLSSIDRAFDRLSDHVDVDVERSGNVLTLTFESGQRVVINSQAANKEVWLAAKSGGYHYRWNETSGRWEDTRSGEDFTLRFAQVTESETGTPFVLG